jgi:hypothetical protein
MELAASSELEIVTSAKREMRFVLFGFMISPLID